MPRTRSSPSKPRGKPRGRQGGRKPFTPTDEQRAFVEIGLAGNLRIEDIAGCLGVDLKTLRKYFPDEVRIGKTRRHVRVVSALFKAIDEGNVTAQIWYTKTQMGWKETARLEHTGKDGEAISYEERLKQIDESAPGA